MPPFIIPSADRPSEVNGGIRSSNGTLIRPGVRKHTRALMAIDDLTFLMAVGSTREVMVENFFKVLSPLS